MRFVSVSFFTLLASACSSLPPAENTGAAAAANEIAPIEITSDPYWMGVWARATSIDGFSYRWGGDQWDMAGASNVDPGRCIPRDPNGCPNCDHEGEWGADCSGFLSKAWGVPEGNTDTTVHNYHFNAPLFNKDRSGLWHTVGWDEILPGDALVNKNHVMLYEQGEVSSNDWYTYECIGCVYGCKHNHKTRAVDRSKWHVIRLDTH